VSGDHVSGATPWRGVLAGALAWGEAHATYDKAVDAWPAALRGRRVDGFAHSGWELVEHLRITQHDLLDFCRNPDYQHLDWPADYWPSTPEPPSDEAWDASVAAYRADRAALRALAEDGVPDLMAPITHGDGQTYLREVLLAIDHAAYHVGQLVAVRQILGAWHS